MVAAKFKKEPKILEKPLQLLLQEKRGIRQLREIIQERNMKRASGEWDKRVDFNGHQTTLNKRGR